MVRRCLVFTLHLLAVIGVGAAFADSTPKPAPSTLDEVRFIADGLANTFQAINDDEISKAVEISWTLMGGDERSHAPPINRDAAIKPWESKLKQLQAYSRSFESIELIGVEPISSQAANLHFVLICEKSPLSLKADIFQYRGKWYVQGMKWSPAFEDQAVTMRQHMVRLPHPLRHTLNLPAAIAEKPKNSTIN